MRAKGLFGVILIVFMIVVISRVSAIDCNNYYFYDSNNLNLNCSLREFCGAYMYQGLFTFDTQEECLTSLASRAQIIDYGGLECKNMYWVDDDNRECGNKSFCGAYLYQGLFTFENQTECQNYALASSQDQGCKNLYWIDNENKSCGQKQFCGAYMYLGLRTFENETGCNAFVTHPCPDIAIPAPGWCNGTIIDGGEDEYGCTRGVICEENKTKTFTLSNGRIVAIKVMPSSASETAITRLGELGFNITLKEVEGKAVYHLEGKKEGKIFAVFKKEGKIEVDVDAEGSGEIISIGKPWWAFAAKGI